MQFTSKILLLNKNKQKIVKAKHKTYKSKIQKVKNSVVYISIQYNRNMIIKIVWKHVEYLSKTKIKVMLKTKEIYIIVIVA